jgi:3-dehydroquinate synthase
MTTSSPSLPPHRTVRVDLGPRAYDVVIGRGLLNEILGWELGKLKHGGKVALLVDEIIATTYGDRVDMSLELSFFLDNFLYKIQSGEPGKTLEQYGKILQWLAEKKFSRSDTILAIGGGVIGDLAGFVAATYLRGINFVQVPTTLLAMVDSSVGGKTGVNLPEGKNLVGAFHQPKLVVADLDTLATLPAKEFSAGMAEVIKYGAIKDKALFDRVAKGVKPGDADLDEIIEKCVAIKARIVENDEFETKGERALLNFGHTIGHAIEKATGYKQYLHGEAISLGMRAAAWLSVWQAGLPEADARRIEAALTANALPLVLKPEVDRAAILAALGNDKKVAADGKNRWVLLKSLGVATSGHELPGDVVEKAVKVILSPPEH